VTDSTHHAREYAYNGINFLCGQLYHHTFPSAPNPLLIDSSGTDEDAIKI
jgi:hypothetical protein